MIEWLMLFWQLHDLCYSWNLSRPSWVEWPSSQCSQTSCTQRERRWWEALAFRNDCFLYWPLPRVSFVQQSVRGNWGWSQLLLHCLQKQRVCKGWFSTEGHADARKRILQISQLSSIIAKLVFNVYQTLKYAKWCFNSIKWQNTICDS